MSLNQNGVHNMRNATKSTITQLFSDPGKKEPFFGKTISVGQPPKRRKKRIGATEQLRWSHILNHWAYHKLPKAGKIRLEEEVPEESVPFSLLVPLLRLPDGWPFCWYRLLESGTWFFETPFGGKYVRIDPLSTCGRRSHLE